MRSSGKASRRGERGRDELHGDALPCGAPVVLREAVAGVGLDDAAGADQAGEGVTQSLCAHAAGAAEIVEGDGDGKLGERGLNAIGGGQDGLGRGRGGVGREGLGRVSVASSFR